MKYFSLIIFWFFYTVGFSQQGCTDPAANNYNALATSNDGSCTYNVSTQTVTQLGVLTPSVPESSGIIYTQGVIWTHNDSGNPAEIFKIDTANGSILQRVFIANYPNTDWEDITADSMYIYISDCGNNNGTRTDLKILRIRKDSIGTALSTTVNATATKIDYADQTSFASNSANNFDCESIIAIGNYLYLFSKDRGDLKTRVYKVSKTPGSYTLTPYTDYNVNGEITGADYNPQTHEVVLIGYMASKKNSFLWFLNDFTNDLFFSGNKRRVELGNSTTAWQTEGVTFRSGNELFISCETSDGPAALYRMAKAFAGAVTGIAPLSLSAGKITVSPNPGNGSYTVQSDSPILDLQLSTAEGQVIYAGKPLSVSALINLHTAAPGIYFLRLVTSHGITIKKLVLSR